MLVKPVSWPLDLWCLSCSPFPSLLSWSSLVHWPCSAWTLSSTCFLSWIYSENLLHTLGAVISSSFYLLIFYSILRLKSSLHGLQGLASCHTCPLCSPHANPYSDVKTFASARTASINFLLHFILVCFLVTSLKKPPLSSLSRSSPCYKSHRLHLLSYHLTY